MLAIDRHLEPSRGCERCSSLSDHSHIHIQHGKAKNQSLLSHRTLAGARQTMSVCLDMARSVMDRLQYSQVDDHLRTMTRTTKEEITEDKAVVQVEELC